MNRTATAIAAALFALTLAAPLAAAPAASGTVDLTQQFRAAGVAVDGLRVYELGGIVLIRGRALDTAAVQNASDVAQSLGYTRVANLLEVVERPDDAAIQRLAERELTIHRSLDGCTFRVASNNGVVHLAGRVAQENQKDMAIGLLRNINGVRAVSADLTR